MNKKIDLNNKYRVLLTEVLPYELPLMLDNEGFYFNIQDASLQKIFNSVFVKLKAWTIPFDYCIHKYGDDKSRKLSLMHPFTQLKWCDFYEKYDDYILSLCKKSPFSIRYIANRAKCILKKVEGRVEAYEESSQSYMEIFDGEVKKYYRSYFSYERYNMVYKFFTSGDYLRLEQKFTHLMTLDIAACFYHIYTHTIAWVIKEKSNAKELIGKKTFENEFDSLMQRSNYNETNGIIVGPEISRIFAEIIFQRIDVNVLNRLKQEPFSLKLGRDYEVRRYVDDHYIYANSDKDLQKILEVYKEEYCNYKLFINEKKLNFFERPFVSDLLDAKREINKLISAIDQNWLTKDNNGNYLHIVKNEMRQFESVVNEFRSLTHKYKQKYGTLNRYMLMLLVSQIGRELRNNEHIVDAPASLLLMYVEITFYVFSLDMSVSASIKICKILGYLHNWAEKCSDKTILPELENRIYRETKRCLDIYEINCKENEINIEVMNLLLCLKLLMKTPFSRMQLMNLFHISSSKDDEYMKLNYFQICTLLYIIENNACYEDVRLMLVKEINRRLTENCALWYADNAMLFFDIMVCPYIEKDEVKNIVKKVFSGGEVDNKYKDLTKTKRWFFNWDKTQNFLDLISKKEYHSPYE